MDRGRRYGLANAVALQTEFHVLVERIESATQNPVSCTDDPSQVVGTVRMLAVMKNCPYPATGECVYGQQAMAVSGQALRLSAVPELADRTCCDTDRIPAGVVSG